MAIDNDKLRYSSAWDIDQIILNEEVTVGPIAAEDSETLTVDLTPFGIDYAPVVEVNYRSSGESVWHQAGNYFLFWELNAGGNPFFPGQYSTDGLSIAVSVSDGTLNIRVDNRDTDATHTAVVRYYVWFEGWGND